MSDKYRLKDSVVNERLDSHRRCLNSIRVFPESIERLMASYEKFFTYKGYTFDMKSSVFEDSEVVTFDLDTLPPWLSRRDISTGDMSWFVDEYLCLMEIGGTHVGDFNTITRVS